jgi:hypothetical protein
MVIGVVVAVFTVLLGIGAVTGKVKATSCCSIADPRRDARMREAFTDMIDPSVAGTEDQILPGSTVTPCPTAPSLP